jgi:hypothetical protein
MPSYRVALTVGALRPGSRPDELLPRSNRRPLTAEPRGAGQRHRHRHPGPRGGAGQPSAEAASPAATAAPPSGGSGTTRMPVVVVAVASIASTHARLIAAMRLPA